MVVTSSASAFPLSTSDITSKDSCDTTCDVASCFQITLYCPNCSVAKHMHISKLWQRHGKNRFCPVHCTTDACRHDRFKNRVGKWLRSPNEKDNTVEAWLTQNNVLQTKGTPVSLFTSQVLQFNASCGQTASASNVETVSSTKQNPVDVSLKRSLPNIGGDNTKTPRRQEQDSAAVASLMPSHTLPVLCYAQVLRAHSVSSVLSSFLRRSINTNACLQSLEAGGGGDCLFHSIGAALELMSQGGPGPAEHIASRCHVSIFRETTAHVVEHLRRIVASSLRQWEETDLLNFLVSGSLEESSGGWRDTWSPSDLLQDYGFGQLVGCDAVRAVGANPSPNADSGDLIVAHTRSSAEAGSAASVEIYLPISQGQSLLVALTNALRAEFQTCGNHHWGTITDCRALSEYFDVGLLIFANNLQHGGTQCLVNVDALRGDHAYYIALWWHNSVHFRLAQYRENEGSPWRSFWSAADLPPSLRAHYNLCNPRAQVGSARRVAVS